jgi:cytoskeletal protein RodZ
VVVTGGVGVGGQVSADTVKVFASTASSTVSNGALIVGGGVGVAGQVTANNVEITATTPSTATSDGALIVGGGVGVAGQVTAKRLAVSKTQVQVTGSSDKAITMSSSSSFIELTADSSADTNIVTMGAGSDGQLVIVKNSDSHTSTVNTVNILAGEAHMFVYDSGGSTWEPLSTPAGRRRLGSSTTSTPAFSSLYSDKRLKNNVQEISKALDKLKQIRGVTFNYIEKPNDFEGDMPNSGVKNVGVIAQEIEKVLPELISEDDKGYKSVQYGNLAGFLVQVNKEQQVQSDAQEAKIEKLEKENENMQNEIKNILRENKSQFQMMMYGFCLVGFFMLVMFGFIVWIVIRQQNQTQHHSMAEKKIPLI